MSDIMSLISVVVAGVSAFLFLIWSYPPRRSVQIFLSRKLMLWITATCLVAIGFFGSMDKGTLGIVILVVVSAAASAWTHSAIRSFILASVVAALASTVLFQVVSFVVELGRIDKFYLIAVVVGAFYAFLISIPVGFVVRRIRAQRQ